MISFRRIISIFFALQICCYLLKGSATADVIHLKNGNRVEGTIIEQTDKEVTIDMDIGTMTFSQDEITSIKKQKVLQRAKEVEEDKAKITDTSSQKVIQTTTKGKPGVSNPLPDGKGQQFFTDLYNQVHDAIVSEDVKKFINLVASDIPNTKENISKEDKDEFHQTKDLLLFFYPRIDNVSVKVTGFEESKNEALLVTNQSTYKFVLTKTGWRLSPKAYEKSVDSLGAVSAKEAKDKEMDALSSMPLSNVPAEITKLPAKYLFLSKAQTKITLSSNKDIKICWKAQDSEKVFEKAKNYGIELSIINASGKTGSGVTSVVGGSVVAPSYNGVVRAVMENKEDFPIEVIIYSDSGQN